MVRGRFDIRRRWHSLLFLFLVVTLAGEARAEKKDYKGLFGNFRRDKFVENEGNASDFGVNILLSTLIPVSTIVTSQEGATSGPLHYSTFFNLELELFLTLSYNWVLFVRSGYYDYDSRLENRVFTSLTDPRFHIFEMRFVPALGGIKYRFGRDDIVPYVGVGGGIAYVERRGYYDFSNVSNRESRTALLGELSGGVEFFFGSRAGLRLELSAVYMKLDERVFDPGVPSTPSLTYKGNPFLIRYASGVFVLF